MIEPSNIYRLGARLLREGGKGARRIPDSVLQRDYCLAWFLVALGRSELMKRIVFKGGTALKRCYFAEYRFSEDLDFTFVAPTDIATVRAELEPVFADIEKACGIKFRFAREADESHENCLQFYLGYDGPIPDKNSEVKVDVTIRELVALPVATRSVERAYAEFTDLPENATVQVYSLGEIAAEKVVALGDRARNAPRDLYDIWYLTSNGHVDVSDEQILEAVTRKMEFRKRPIDKLGAEFKNKEARLKAQWEKSLSQQMMSLPEFEGVFRAVQRSLREAGLLE